MEAAVSGIPILLTWPAMDLLPENHPSFCGRPGMLGQRGANIILQKSTHLYVFGARLDNETVGYDYEGFAPNAEIHVFDVDSAEILKLPKRYKGHFIVTGNYQFDFAPSTSAWLEWCKKLHNELDNRHSYQNIDTVDPAYIADWLHKHTTADDIIALGSSGQAPCSMLQNYRVRKGQRVIGLSTFGPMGADIPMAIGACIASGKRRTICVTGDGGFMLNMHELEIVRRLNLPIKFIVLNNGGYNTIKQSQLKRFGKATAADRDSGFTIPAIRNVANCFMIRHCMVARNDFIPLYEAFANNDPAVIECMVSSDWIQYPRMDSTMNADGTFTKDSLHDMTPKLDNLDELMRWDGD
jgi:acetolactate synthase-1/2/3 large subunit